MRLSVDLINVSLAVHVDHDIPQRVWTRKDVSHKHLKVFGCITFLHISKDEGSKLDS